MELKPSGTWLMSDELMSSMIKDQTLFVRRRFRKDEEIYSQDSVVVESSSVVGLGPWCTIAIDPRGRHRGDPRTDGAARPFVARGRRIDGLPRFSGATALEETELLEFDAGKLPQLAAHSPEFVAAVLQVTALKQRVLAVRLEQLSSREPETRILEMFGRLARVFAETRDDGKLIVPKLTHEQIAAMTGNTRVTVTRTLGRLKERGEIAIVEGRILLISDRFRD